MTNEAVKISFDAGQEPRIDLFAGVWGYSSGDQYSNISGYLIDVP